MLARHRRLRLLLTCSLGAVLLLVASAGVVRMRADASWREMLQRSQELQQQVAARDPHREPLWGEATAGKAFDHYERAAGIAKELSGDDHAELVASLRMTDATVTDATAELRARWRPALQAMQLGARCDQAEPPPYWHDDPQAGIPNLLACRWIMNMAILEARVQRLAGHTQTAVQWSLDAATFASDTVRRGPLIRQMIGVALVAIAYSAWSEPALQQLDGTALELLANGLARLDAQLPRHLGYEDELLFLASHLERVPEEGVGLGSLAAWHYGFSTRWMTANAFTRFADAMQRLDDGTHGAGDERWQARRTRLNATFASLANSGNPASSLMTPNLVAAEQNLREALAQVRILRIAVELHRGHPAPELADPCGDGPITVMREDDGWRLRSAAHGQGHSMERFVAN